MSGNSIFEKGVLSALAVALVTTAMPSTAFAQQERRDERGGRAWSGGESRRDAGQRGDAQRGGGDFGARANAQERVRAAQAQPQQRSANPAWQGRGGVENAPRWGSQDRGTRPGRDWQQGTVNRPAPAARAAPPATPQRGWDGTRWNPTNPASNPDRSVNRERDGNRDRNWSNERNRPQTWSGRNQGYSDRDRNRDYRRDDNTRNRDGWNNRDDRREGWSSGNRNSNRRWSNDWRNDRRYDWSGYRSSNRNHYRMPRYYAPYRGYNYSRLSIGFFLNSGFYGSSYWINDPWSYRLPPAYAGYRWIRYYDDVLLVDTYSGEVVDVIYNFFW